jgi:hydroxymethylpyrimidine pyrophosphatase-like HAD family hydrolase
VALYLGKVKEFYTEKPKTIFCDIDGTIIKHAHMFSEISKHKSEALAGVVAKFNEWDAKGHKVILTTARKESARQGTEKALEELGLSWDLLIMGVTSGTRVLINDKLNRRDPDRAIAVSLITDEGFISEDWSKYGL